MSSGTPCFWMARPTAQFQSPTTDPCQVSGAMPLFGAQETHSLHSRSYHMVSLHWYHQPVAEQEVTATLGKLLIHIHIKECKINPEKYRNLPPLKFLEVHWSRTC